MIGRTFLNRYEITRLIGEGGMGRVFLARQIDLNRQVVVKVMSDAVANDPKFRLRFERETRLMAKFQHPYVVALYDASLDDPLGPCIVMEYIRGVNLDYLLDKNKRFAAARVGRLLGQLCEALQAAHDAGIIHRDLKPSNIMIVDPDSPRERIKVMDFGLAKDITPNAEIARVTVTNDEFAVGTPGYICPEQVRGDPVDHRGDLYSVGVLAYELLTGQLPFNGPTGMDMVLAHATEPPPRFADIGLDGTISPHIEEVVMQVLAKDPADRPQSASELSEKFDLALLKATQDAANRELEPLEIHVPDAPAEPFEDTTTAPVDDPNAVEFHVEAWMPQKIALLKLRGFVQAQGGEILESKPGLIRVRLDAPVSASNSAGPLRWIGLGKRTTQLFLDLRMTASPAKENLLQIAARFHAPGVNAGEDPLLRRHCVNLFIDLRGYLIGAEG
ncbi:MAG: serine/threonine protein kinase [Gemmataceae bacterium]|nr:serine/threonine protein kinase [Gemmataceae bacterium]